MKHCQNGEDRGEEDHGLLEHRQRTMPCTGQSTSGAALAAVLPVKAVVEWQLIDPLPTLSAKPRMSSTGRFEPLNFISYRK